MSETVIFAPADTRALVLPGMPADKQYTFEIRAYRKVDSDVAATGVILSPPIISDAYTPATTIAFNGDLTGTIQGRGSLQVVLNLENIASDSVLSTTEKPQIILTYNLVVAQWQALHDKALALGMATAEANAAITAKNALDTYLGGLSPLWSDTTQHTPIDKVVFQQKWDDFYVTMADLQAAIQGIPGADGEPGAPGADGKYTQFIYRRAATKPATPTGNNPAGWSEVPPTVNADPLWMSQALKNADGTLSAGATWSSPIRLDGVAGVPGAPAVTGYLTSESVQVPAYANGNVASYAGAGSQFKVYAGQNDVSASFSLSVVSNPQALTVTVNNTTQSFSITGGLDNSEDSGSLTVRMTGTGTYTGAVVDKVFKLGKLKGGYEIVTALPTSNLFQGRMVFNETDDKLYTYKGTSWVATVDTTTLLGIEQIPQIDVDKLIGQIPDSKIAGIDVGKLIGDVGPDQIAAGAIDAAKFAANIEPVRLYAGVPATFIGNTVLNTNNNRTYVWKGTAYEPLIGASDDLPAGNIVGQVTNAQIAGVDAAKLTGTIAEARIGTVSAPKITGSITNAQIADLSAAKLTGTINEARIGTVSAPKITGTLTDAQIADLAATKISGQLINTQISSGITASKISGALTNASIAAAGVTGQLTNAQLASIDAAKLTGTIDGSKIDAVAAVKVTGQLTDAQIAGVSTAKLTGQITSTQISNDAITTPKLAAGAVTAAVIAAGTITADQMAINSIGTAELQAGSVTSLQIAAGAVTAVKIEANSIDASRIAAGAITTSELAAGAVTSNEIAAGTIVAGNIAAGAITGEKIVAGEITASKLALTDGDNLILDSLIADQNYWTLAGGMQFSLNPTHAGLLGVVTGVQSAVGNGTTSQTQDNATSSRFPVEGGKPYRFNAIYRETLNFSGFPQLVIRWKAGDGSEISASAISGIDRRTAGAPSATNQVIEGQLSAPANAVMGALQLRTTWSSAQNNAGAAIMANPRVTRAMSAEMIVDGTITAAKVAAASITGDKLVANTIGAREIAANSITATQIAANAITTSELSANAVTAAHIVAGTITANELATNSVTASEIAAGAVEADKIAANAVTAAKIEANAVTTAKLAAGAVVTANLAASAVTASKLSLVDTNNAIPDPFFEDTSYWTTFGGTTFVSGAGPAAMFAPAAIQVDGTGATGQGEGGAVSRRFAVEPSRPYRFRAITRWNTGFNGVCFLLVRWYNHSGVQISGDFSIRATDFRSGAAASSPTNETIGGILDSPGDASFCEVSPRVAWPGSAASAAFGRLSNIRAMRAANAEMIVDGAITTDKLSANSVTSGKVAANTITASKLLISETSNLILDQDVQDPDYWIVVGGTTISTVLQITEPLPTNMGARAGFASSFGNGTTSQSADYAALHADPGKQIPVEPGAPYRVSFTARAISGFTGRTYAAVQWSDGAGAVISTQFVVEAWDYRTSASTGRAAFDVTGIINAPDNAVTARPIFYTSVWSSTINNGGRAYIARPRMQRAADGKIIVDGSITAQKVAAATITGDKLVANTIGAREIAANSITATQIAANTITAQEIAANAITTSELAAGAVTAGHIVAGTITSNELGANSVVAGKIAAAAVSTEQLAANAITTDKLTVASRTDNLVPNGKTADGTVDGWTQSGGTGLIPTPNAWGTGRAAFRMNKAANGDSTNARCTPFPMIPGKQYVLRGALRSTNENTATGVYLRVATSAVQDMTSVAYNHALSNGPITNNWQDFEYVFTCPVDHFFGQAQVYSHSTGGPLGLFFTDIEVRELVDGVRIADGAIVANKIAANSVTAAKIAANTITASEIAANAVTASELAANAVTANHIVAGTITGDRLAANTITASEIAANAITASELAALAVTAGHLSANAVTADKIDAGAVTAAKINVTNLSAINSNLGSITAGSLNIGGKFIVNTDGTATIRSGTTGQRTEVTQDGVRVYDSGGTMRVRLGVW